MRLGSSARKASCLFGLGAVVVALASVTPAVAASASARTAPATCSGTLKAPGVLAGTYLGNVVVSGVCFVNAGPTTVEGNLTVAAGGAVNATFGLNDTTKKGYSNLTVDGNLFVDAGATVVLGCDPANSACSDDPSTTTKTPPTFSSWDWVLGNLIATDPLGAVLHDTFIGKNLSENGGGGGVNCTPTGIFAYFQSPVFSDFENVAVGGNMSITNLKSCWLGSLRDAVHGHLTVINNKMFDRDANEILTNYVNGALTCIGNLPAVQFGDSGGSANVVNGKAYGQCSFSTLKPNPPPTGELQHISVRSTV